MYPSSSTFQGLKEYLVQMLTQKKETLTCALRGHNLQEHDLWSLVRACLQPKVVGSWNLHEQLLHDLDFFVIFSSLPGIISLQGQSNYVAGNTYEDELAQYRLNRGEKAIALNLSLLAREGYAAENQEALMQFVKTKHMQLMSQLEVFAILNHYYNNTTPAEPQRS
jgi:sulfur carrier protein ThiS